MFLLRFLMIFLFATPKINTQQSYSGNLVMNCDNNDSTGPSPAFLYTCNGKESCKTFLIYKSQPPYHTVSSISKLTSSDPLELALINNISNFTVLPTNKEVIVPIICSCSSQYYQANTSYIIPSIYDTYFSIAESTYEGLSTCNSLMRQNNYSEFSLDVGMELRVPLRCACPTSNQSANGTKYLLTYSVSWGDKVRAVSERFNASIDSVNYANGFTKDDTTLFPFTTILVPLSTEPSSFQTIVHYPPPPYSPPFIPVHPIRRSRKKIHVWVIPVIIVSALPVVLFIVLLLRNKKSHLGVQREKEGKNKEELPDDFLDHVAHVDLGLKIYTFEELKVATEDFSTSNRLSDSVYRGVISGQVLAIKKMSKDVSNEVTLLRKINHFNLISLHAACEHHGVFYLMYEFMDNGSLRDWLYKRNCLEAQSWNRRIQIALDVANGLHYLHNFTDPPYVHKDISSSNVLLSRHLRAKIANFSLARSAKAEEHVNSSLRLALGSKGYLAPEFIDFGLVTPEIDIYAFGVVLLELVTGKEAVYMQEERKVQLSETIISIMEKENAEARLGCIVDPNLQSQHSMEVVLRMVKLSLACLAQEPESRPSMAEIVSALLKIQLDVHRSCF
eukprot:XP_002533279.2 protein LYK5 [Ricinus communis]